MNTRGLNGHIGRHDEVAQPFWVSFNGVIRLQYATAASIRVVLVYHEPSKATSSSPPSMP